MAWKKGKLLKSKKPYKTWSKNPSKVDSHEMKNLYKGHVKSMERGEPIPPDKSWQGIRAQGIDRWNKIALIDTKFEKFYCYFSGTKAYFVHANALGGWLKKSIIYSTDRARYLRDFMPEDTRFTWIERTNIPL